MSLSKIRGVESRRRAVADKLTKRRLPVSVALTAEHLISPDSSAGRFNFQLMRPSGKSGNIRMIDAAITSALFLLRCSQRLAENLYTPRDGARKEESPIGRALHSILRMELLWKSCPNSNKMTKGHQASFTPDNITASIHITQQNIVIS